MKSFENIIRDIKHNRRYAKMVELVNEITMGGGGVDNLYDHQIELDEIINNKMREPGLGKELFINSSRQSGVSSILGLSFIYLSKILGDCNIYNCNTHNQNIVRKFITTPSFGDKNAIGEVSKSKIQLNDFTFKPFRNNTFDDIIRGANNENSVFIIDNESGVKMYEKLKDNLPKYKLLITIGYNSTHGGIINNNGVDTLRINWKDVPGRGDKWLESSKKMLGNDTFSDEYNNGYDI